MKIVEQLQCLAKLGQIEAEMRKYAEELKRIPAEANTLREKADQLRKELEVLESQELDVQREKQRMEGDLLQEKSNLRKWEARLDSIRNEREHAALRSEIGSQRRGISALENKIIDAMENLEAVSGEVNALRPSFESADSDARSAWDSVADNVKEIEDKVTTLRSTRDNEAKDLPAALIKRYERIVEKRVTGVAIIEGETCSSCFRQIPPQLVIQVYRGELIEGCPSCQRILVHEKLLPENKDKTSVESDAADGSAG